MTKKHSLVLTLAVLGWFNTGTVWVTQFSCYPLWPYVGPHEFGGYYEFWQRGTLGLVTLPFALAAAGALALLVLGITELPRPALWLGLGLQAAIEITNWLWFMPLEGRIATPTGALNAAAYQQLVASNWLRIGLVSAYAVLILWMLSRCLWPTLPDRRGRSLLFATSALGLYSVGCIWMVHLVCYGLWPYIGREEAYTYHIAWWHSIWGVLFIPAGLDFLGALAMLWVRPSGITRRVAWVGFILQVVTYALTAGWWGPLMARLATQGAGLSLPLYHLLMNTHWGRVALLTAYGVTCCCMLTKSAPCVSRSEA